MARKATFSATLSALLSTITLIAVGLSIFMLLSVEGENSIEVLVDSIKTTQQATLILAVSNGLLIFAVIILAYGVEKNRAKIHKQRNGSQQRPSQNNTQKRSEKEQDTDFCMSCGSIISDGDNDNCPNCGEKTW